jgi:hypothetical protein
MADLLLISEVFRFPHRRYYWQMKFLRPRVYLLNWQKRKVVKAMVVPPAYFHDEEYRFLRLCYHYSGARGIAANRKYIFVALQNAILVYDRGLRHLVTRIDHPLFNGIHEIVWHEDRLYVTCAVTDSVLVMSETGEERQRFYLGNHRFFLEQFDLPRRELDNRLDYRLMHRVRRLYHVNTVQVVGEAVYVNLNRQGSFVKIYPEAEIVIRDKDLKESHNAQFSPDGRYILINDTGHYALRVFEAGGRPLRTIDVREFPLPIDFCRQTAFGPSSHFIKAGWLRGLAFSKENEAVVYLGLSPAMVVAVNYITGAFLGYFRFRRNIWISVHGLHNLSRS